MENDTNERKKWLAIQSEQKKSIQTNHRTDLTSRLKRLDRLKRIVLDHEEEWFEALKSDLGKPLIETYTSEIGTVLNEIEYLKDNLKDWMTAKKQTSRSLTGKTEKSLLRQPHGSVLIISPWNYPLQLTMVPLAGALAAGNRCFIKPSEKSSAVSHLLNRLISHYFTPDDVYVVEGEAEVAQRLLEMSWDHIFFTGSSAVGQKVYEAASKNLTPVTLELGGKNPCIVDETNCTRESVKKIIWGKFLNAGQTCIAPDTVYVHETVIDRFKSFAVETVHAFYGSDPEKSEAYGRLIDKKQFEHVTRLLSQGQVVHGGRSDEETLYIEPTLMESIEEGSELASGEVFGPILPIVPYHSLQLLLNLLQQKSPPLVTYYFTEDRDRAAQVQQAVKTGAVMVNQVILNSADPEMPFGGVGKSGFGRYHGYSSFKTFTYEKTFYYQTADYANKLIYPPYSRRALAALRFIRKRLR